VQYANYFASLIHDSVCPIVRTKTNIKEAGNVSIQDKLRKV